MSRIFNNCMEAQSEIQRDLFEMGTEVQPYSMQDKIVADQERFLTKELQGYSYSILHFDNMEDMGGLDLNWALEDFQERISSALINPGKAWKHRNLTWFEFLHDGKFSYTYNERMRTQLRQVIDELKIHPASRQAIIEIHNNIIDLQNMGGQRRIPCSMFYQFLLRNNKLDIYYVMRSCDFLTHWVYDVWHAIRLLMYMSRQVGVTEGKFIHYITSLHAYKKDMPKGIF